ncbi:hypothetical protein PCANB_002232 [Pneumocystis canis]|nr:hypothetical protein PCK1_002302 [Pneumocystis canis]KAG5438902.1 hypothetical protein PCANB_002232 [Pneumocystis canis]
MDETTNTAPLMLTDYPSNNHSSSQSSTLRLDQLGPVVINSDGTLARIENWLSLTDIEKRRIERVLVQRNQERLKKLQKQNENNEKLN